MNLNQDDFLELTNDILGRGNSLRFRVHGGSMHPFIKDGDVIEVKPVTISKIRLGDAIFYPTSWGMLRVHRAIKKHKKNGRVILMTKGDVGLNFDPPLQGDNIMGKVIAIEKSNVTINLNCKSWRIANYMIATYSLLPISIYKGICFLKRVLIGNRKNRLIYLGSKVLFFSLSLPPKSLINFLCIMQRFKSKLKPNTA